MVDKVPKISDIANVVASQLRTIDFSSISSFFTNLPNILRDRVVDPVIQGVRGMIPNIGDFLSKIPNMLTEIIPKSIQAGVELIISKIPAIQEFISNLIPASWRKAYGGIILTIKSWVNAGTHILAYLRTKAQEAWTALATVWNKRHIYIENAKTVGGITVTWMPVLLMLALRFYRWLQGGV